MDSHDLTHLIPMVAARLAELHPYEPTTQEVGRVKFDAFLKGTKRARRIWEMSDDEVRQMLIDQHRKQHLAQCRDEACYLLTGKQSSLGQTSPQ